MSSLVFRITGDPSAFKAAMGEVSGSLDGVGRKSDELSGKLGSLGTKMSIGLTAPILALGASVIKTATDMDSLKRGLTAVAGSSEEAERQLKRLQEVAKLPGLGFRDAVEGSIRLQAAGFNAALAERSLKAFGNALATVGKGKAELDGVTLALSQIASKGKISAEEINQLAERVPQIRVAIKDAFGTADTEVLQKAGIKAEEFVTKVVAQLEKLKQVTGGPKNAFENLSDAVEKSAARIGEKFFPIVESTLPKLESLAIGAADAVDAFLALPEPIKNTAIALGALTVAAGPVSSAVGGVISSIGGIKAAAGVAGVAIGALFGAAVIASIAQTMTAIDQLNDRYKALAEFRERQKTGKEDLIQYKDEVVKTADAAKRLGIDTKAIATELNLFGATAKQTTVATRDVTVELANAAASTGKFQKALEMVKLPTLDLLVLKERMRDAFAAEAREVDKAAETMGRYGAVTLETAKQRAAAADLIFRTQRDLGIMTGVDQAPDMGGFGIDFKKLPKAPDAGLPSSVSFEEFKRMGKNVGELGMITKEQYEAMKQASKSSSKVQVEAVRQVSLVLTDLSRGITDVIFKGGKFGDTLKGVATEAAKSITRILIEGALKKLGESLLGIGKTSTSVFGSLGGLLGGIGKVFGSGGTGAVMSHVPGVTALGLEGGGLAGIPGIGGGAGKAVGSIAGAGLSAAVGAIAGVGSLVSGIIGNFQMKGMNKTLDLLEKSARYTEAYTLSILEKHNEFLPYLKSIHERMVEFRQVGIKLEAGGSLAMAGGGDSYYFDFSGANLGGVNQQTVEKMFETAVIRFKQKGLSK